MVRSVSLTLVVGLVALSASAMADASTDPAATDTKWVEGDLSFKTPGTISADLRLDETSALYWIDDPTVDVGPLFDAFTLTGESLTALHREQVRCTAGCNANLPRSGWLEDGPHGYDDFTVTLNPAGGPQYLVVHDTLGDGGTVHVEGWNLATIPKDEALKEPQIPAGPPSEERQRVPARSVVLTGHEITLTDIDPGQIDIYGFDVIIHYTNADGDREEVVYQTGEGSVTEGAPLGQSQTDAVAVRDTWLTLRPVAATLDLSGQNVQARVVSPYLTLAGTFAWTDLDGRLDAGDDQYRYDGRPAAIDGAFVFRALDGPMASGEAAPADLHRVRVVGQAFGLQSAAHPVAPTDAATMSNVALAGFGIVALLGIAWARGWLAVPAAALYAKIQDDAVLQSATRTRILELVRASPGVSMREAARSAECGWGALSYHVGILDRLGHVRIRKDGNRNRLFPMDGTPVAQHQANALAREPSVARLLHVIALEPGITQTVLAERASLSQSQVSRLLGRMRTAGLLEGDTRRTRGMALSPLADQIVHGDKPDTGGAAAIAVPAGF